MSDQDSEEPDRTSSREDSSSDRATAEPLAARLPVTSDFWTELYHAYEEPPRHYHTFEHVRAVVRQFDRVARELGWRRPREVFLAVLFHDAVYNAGRPDNERASARLAVRAIDRWLPVRAVDSARVAELIELTARHGHLDPASVDRDAALFIDCDMAILGADADTYRAYADAVAKEFAPVVPRAAYIAGRRAFLERLAKVPRIFLSEHFHQRLDGAVRRNLRRELARLAAESLAAT